MIIRLGLQPGKLLLRDRVPQCSWARAPLLLACSRPVARQVLFIDCVLFFDGASLSQAHIMFDRLIHSLAFVTSQLKPLCSTSYTFTLLCSTSHTFTLSRKAGVAKVWMFSRCALTQDVCLLQNEQNEKDFCLRW